MGLDVNGTKFLLYAKTQGVCFAKTAMIGRQGLHLNTEAFRKNLSDFGYFPQEDEINSFIDKSGGFAETFLGLLGAAEICSFDASDYENASSIIDFNFPINEGFKNRFTAVLDGGTLEHIFNFPIAIKNCMEMVEVGGHFLGITPTNNFLGHGFYQFSPELFFRIFDTQNGFKLVRIILFEDIPEADWFEVTDPNVVRERITLVNTRPTYLLIIARKVKSVQIFATPPQQSDYVALWKSSDTPLESNIVQKPKTSHEKQKRAKFFSRVVHKLYSFAPAPLKSFYRTIRNPQPRASPYKPRFFRRIQVP